MSRLYVIRHAWADWTPDEMRPLSAEGRADARRVADLLIDAGIEAVYSSPYRRARQTVEPLSHRLGLPIQELDDLRERELVSGAADDFEEAVRATWHNFTFAHPGGETNRDAQSRVARTFDLLARRHGERSMVLSTHGSLMTLLLNHIDPSIGFEFWARLTFPDVYHVTTEQDVRVDRVWIPREPS